MKKLDELGNFCIVLFVNGIMSLIAGCLVAKYLDAEILGLLFVLSAIFHFIISIEFINKNPTNR